MAFSSFSQLLGQWPDLKSVARDLGLPYETVFHWKRRGNIPPLYWNNLAAAARRRGLRGVSVEALGRAATRAATSRREAAQTDIPAN